MFNRLSQRGFSLGETLIAIFIIVVGLAGVTSALVYGVKNSTRGREMSDSVQVARTLFEYIQGNSLVDTLDLEEEWLTDESGLNDAEGTRRRLNEAPFGGVNFTAHQVTRFKRHIAIERLNQNNEDHRYNLARAVITVTWTDDQGEHQSELIGVIRHARS